MENTRKFEKNAAFFKKFDEADDQIVNAAKWKAKKIREEK